MSKSHVEAEWETRVGRKTRVTMLGTAAAIIATALACGAVAPTWASVDPAVSGELVTEQTTPTMFPGSKTIPAARAGEPFEHRIIYAGKTDAVTAEGLPAGLKMDASGLITGTPAVKSGSYTFTLAAFDKLMAMKKTETASIRVDPAIPDGPPLAIAGTPPAEIVYNQPFTYAFTLSGPGATARVSSGALPPGLSLTGDGLLSGRLTAGPATTYTFSVVAENDFETSVPKEFSLTVPAVKNHGSLGSSSTEFDYSFRGFETIAWNTYSCPEETPYLIDHEFTGGVWPRGAALYQTDSRIYYSATKLWRDGRQSGVENLHMYNSLIYPASAKLVLHCTNDANAAAR
jgi:hypothetical protein